jgi:hypothetical protein
MMEDANQWLNTVQKGESIEEFKHPKTGATALHVASAKGYVKVMTYGHFYIFIFIYMYLYRVSK